MKDGKLNLKSEKMRMGSQKLKMLLLPAVEHVRDLEKLGCSKVDAVVQETKEAMVPLLFQSKLGSRSHYGMILYRKKLNKL